MKLFKAGKYVNQGHHQSFQPDPINREWQLEDMEIVGLLSKADRQVGRLDMYSEYIPNINLFISMPVAKEATQSSRIEGTRTNMEEALLGKEHISPEKVDDWEEVQNYIEAMSTAIKELERLPVSSLPPLSFSFENYYAFYDYGTYDCRILLESVAFKSF